tara:strand:- start:354 stop:557 length:204 start_codon:yes stop_codon:yes gene_type:complete
MSLENILKHRAGIITEEITPQQFVDMVNDEFNLETLELMKQVIENQMDEISSGQDMATRNPIKGFGQ